MRTASRKRRTAIAISTLASNSCRSSAVIPKKSAAAPNFQPAASRALRFLASIVNLPFAVSCRVVIFQASLAPLDNLVRNLPGLFGVNLQNQNVGGIQAINDSPVMLGVPDP